MPCDFIFVYFINEKRLWVSQKSGCVEKNEIVQHIRPKFQVEISYASLSNIWELFAAWRNTQNLDYFLCDPNVQSPWGLGALTADIWWAGRRELHLLLNHHALTLMERGAVLIPDLLDVSLLWASLMDLV